MPLSGAAIGPDAVMVWTSERELTRFDRSGARSSFTVPMPPLAAQISRDGLRVVDGRGTIHHYSLTGRHEGATPLREPIRGAITAAALAAGSPCMAVVIETPAYEYPSREASVFTNGEAVAWHVERPSDGYDEVAVDLSRDGRWLLIRYETFAYFNGWGSSGNRGAGVHVVDSAGKLRIEYMYEAQDVLLSPGGDYIAWTDTSPHGRSVCLRRDDDREWTLACHGPTARFTFGDDMLGAVFADPSILEVMQLSTGRRAQLELPEQFDELIFSGDDAVVVHPELGAWWIPLASLRFEDVS